MKTSMAVCTLIFLFGFSTFAVADGDLKGNKADAPRHPNAEQMHTLGENIGLIASLKAGYDCLDFDRDTSADYKNLLSSSDSFFVYGPAFVVTYKQKYYAGASYLGGQGAGSNHDLDIFAGYSFHPKMSLFLGYKYLQFSADFDAGKIGETDWESGEENWIYKGPVIGLDINYPFKNSGFILFGTMGYAVLNFTMDNSFSAIDSSGNLQESEDGSESESKKADGLALDLGVSYCLQRLPQLSITAQFKYQNYTSENDWKVAQTGYIFGVNYLF